MTRRWSDQFEVVDGKLQTKQDAAEQVLRDSDTGHPDSHAALVASRQMEILAFTQLTRSIEQASQQSSQLNRTMIWPTVAIVVMTFVLVGIAIWETAT